jgi:Tfp pilus assembly protein PilX
MTGPEALVTVAVCAVLGLLTITALVCVVLDAALGRIAAAVRDTDRLGPAARYELRRAARELRSARDYMLSMTPRTVERDVAPGAGRIAAALSEPVEVGYTVTADPGPLLARLAGAERAVREIAGPAPKERS